MQNSRQPTQTSLDRLPNTFGIKMPQDCDPREWRKTQIIRLLTVAGIKLLLTLVMLIVFYFSRDQVFGCC